MGVKGASHLMAMHQGREQLQAHAGAALGDCAAPGGVAGVQQGHLLAEHAHDHATGPLVRQEDG